ncbi:hypothetical protein FDP51_02395 [Enterococcus mundtii]|uniref:hypothetical protein n=1 Tax=Enterococcus mundtii TaxID=53346 RepID=UPI00129CC613|nr:hypothetical protein [Enterococcus mundtii]MRI72885.1 hypothetical protein [Enterococcus mundtii]
MFYKKYEDYLKEYLNKDISIKSVKPHEEKIFNEFQAKAILDSNSETLREEFHFVLDLISSRKEVNEEKTNDLKKSFERMIQGIDPSDYNALRFSIYKSRMMVLKENIRERETSSKEVPPTFTSNTSLQASDELVSPKLVAEQEKRFAEQATLNKRDNGKQEALSNEQIKENVATYVNLAHTTNQSTKEEQHQRPKVSDLKERFEKERSYNKEPHSAEVPSGTVNRLRQYYEGLNHSTNDHSPLESRKSSRWRTSQTNDSPNVQNRQNQPTDRQNQRNEGTSSYQKSPPLKGTSEFVRRGYERTVYTNESSPINKAEPDQTGMTNEELQRRRDRFGNMPGPSNEPPVIKRTTQSEPDNYQTATYQNPPRQQRSSELVQKGQASRIDNNDSLRTNNAEWSQTGRANEEFQRYRDRFGNMPGPSNEPPVIERTTQSEPYDYQTVAYQNPPRQQRSSELVHEGQTSRIDNNDSLRTNNVEWSRAGRTDKEFQNRRARFVNLTSTSNEPAFSKKKGRGESEHQGTSYQRATTLHGSSEIVRKGNGSAVHTNDSASANETKSNQNDMTNEEFQNRRTRFENSSVKSDNHLASESTGRVKAVRDQFENPNAFSNERSIPEPTGQVRAARERFEKANEFSNDRPVPESTGQVRAARERFEKPNVLRDERPAPESTGRVKAASDQFAKANDHPNERPAPESTGRVRVARERFEKVNALRDERPAPESTGRVRAARDRFEKANVLRDERPAPESTGRVRAARDRFEKANEFSNDRPVPEPTGQVKAARDRFEKANEFSNDRLAPESTGRVEAMRRQYESRTGRETEASVSNETLQQQNGLANETFRQHRGQFENPAVKSSDGQKSEESVTSDQLDRRKESSNQPTALSADQTGIVDGNTKKIRELLADKLKFNPIEKEPPETNTQTDSSNVPVEESSSDTQNSQMRNQMSEGGEPKPTKLDEASIATRGMDKKQSENITDPLDKHGIDASSSTLGLNENASEKTDKTTETDFMDDDIELPESGPHTQKKKIHTKKSRAIQIGRLLLNLLPLASWPLISMWVTGILGIVPAYLAMYGLPLTLFIYGTILTAVYGPKLINYIRKLRSRIQNYRQSERSRQRNLEDRVIDPKEKSIQRETAAHEKETAKTKQQNHSSEKGSPENSEKDKSVKGYFKRNWKSLAIIFGVGIVVAGIGIALTPVVAPYIFAIATSTPLFMYKVTSVIAMALAVSFGVTALSKGLHALQRKFYKKEDQTLETTTQKETIEKNSLEVDKNFDKAYETVDKNDLAPVHDNSSIKSAESKEDGMKVANAETKSTDKSPYAWVYGQETENKTQNESNRSSRSNSFNTHETLHVKADIHEPPSQSARENRATNQLSEAARHRVNTMKSESNPQIAEQNKGNNRQPAVKEAFDSIKQKAISKSNNVSGKPLLKGQISFEK